MSKTPIIVTTLCAVCAGEKKILNRNCGNCKATGYIHRELVQDK